MTPYLFRVAVEALNRRRRDRWTQIKWQTWHGAVLQRVKKIPLYGDFVQDKKQNGMTPEQIMAQLRAYQEGRKNGNSRKS